MIIRTSTIGKALFHRLVCSMTQTGLELAGVSLQVMQDDVGGVLPDAESMLDHKCN